jgi:hypothetical protein
MAANIMIKHERWQNYILGRIKYIQEKFGKKNTLAGKRRKGKELWTLFEDD